MWKTTGMWTPSPPGIRALSRTRGIQPIWMLAFNSVESSITWWEKREVPLLFQLLFLWLPVMGKAVGVFICTETREHHWMPARHQAWCSAQQTWPIPSASKARKSHRWRQVNCLGMRVALRRIWKVLLWLSAQPKLFFVLVSDHSTSPLAPPHLLPKPYLWPNSWAQLI